MNRAFILSQGAARDIGNTSYRTINEPSGVEDSIQIERFLPGGCWYASCGHALGLNSVPCMAIHNDVICELLESVSC